MFKPQRLLAQLGESPTPENCPGCYKVNRVKFDKMSMVIFIILTDEMPVSFYNLVHQPNCHRIKFKSLLQGNGNGNGTSDSGDGDAANGGGNGENGGGSLKVTEQQVARLMEEDMGTAMQYLQGKGLCLMPISLASAISSATSSSLLSRPSIGSMGSARGPAHEGGNPASPPLMNGAGGDDSRTVKDAGAGSKQ